MGRCKYGEPIRKRQQEALEELRTTLMVKPSPSDSDLDSRDAVGVDEDEGDDVEGSEDEVPLGCDSHWWIPSLLTPLKGKAVEPKVVDDRVTYEKGTNKGDSCDMAMWELRLVAEDFPWPKGVELRLPCPDGGALAKYPGCFVVYEEALNAGFRLPLHPFIRDFLSLKNYCPAQLTPNSWRCILAFLLKFKELNLVPSYEAFKSFYETKSEFGIHSVYFKYINLISNPRYLPGTKSWGNKWFLVCQTEAIHFNFPMYPGDRRWCSGYTIRHYDKSKRHAEVFCKSLPDSKPSYKNVIDVRRLEKAGLSLPHPVIGFYINSGKSISKRKREVPSTSGKKSRSLCNDLASANPHKRPMVVCSVSSAVVKRENVGITEEEPEEEEEEQEEEEDPEEEEEEEQEEEEDPEEEEEENVGIAHEEEEEKDEEELASIRLLEMCIDHALGNSTHVHGEKGEEEEKDEEEEDLAFFAPLLGMRIETAPSDSTHVHGEKEVSHEDGNDVPSEFEKSPSSPHGFGGTSSISTICRPEVSASLRRLLPDIIQAAQHTEALEHELNKSRQENIELKREKAELECQLIVKDREFQSRIERMEQDKKSVEEELIETQAKLAQTAQKAKELLDLSSPLGMKR